MGRVSSTSSLKYHSETPITTVMKLKSAIAFWSQTTRNPLKGPLWARQRTVIVRLQPSETDWERSHHLVWRPTHCCAIKKGSKAINHNWVIYHACSLAQNLHVFTYFFLQWVPIYCSKNQFSQQSLWICRLKTIKWTATDVPHWNGQ